MTTTLPRFLTAAALFVVGLSGFAQQGPGTPTVVYDPPIKRVEGPLPFATSVVINVTSPSNVPNGGSVTITPSLTVLNAPAGVSNATALSYVTVTPATVTFTGPNQTIPVTFVGNYPGGTSSGAYGYQMFTNGWPGNPQDQGAFINVTIFPPLPPAGPPTVDIAVPLANSTYTYAPAVGPLLVPFQFTASAPTSSPLTSVDADLNGAGVAVTPVVNTDGSRSVSTNVSITSPGLYTLRARGTNAVGTAEDTVSFNVVLSVPPPTVAIATPLAGSVHTLSSSGSVSVPYSFSGATVYGGVSTLTATLNGNPVTFSPAGIGTLLATGSGNFTLTTPGTYTLVVTTTDTNGGTASTSRTFTVEGARPPPTVTINAPANGTTITRVVGSGPTSVSFKYTGQAATGSVITALVGTLSGTSGNVSATVTGLNTRTAVGTGTLSIANAGTYTLTAVATSNGATASASTTFTIVEVQPPPPTCSVNWLPPISLNQIVNVNCYLPIKFELDCEDDSGSGCSGNHNGKCDDRDCDKDRDRDCKDGKKSKSKSKSKDRDCDRDDDGDRDHYPGQRTKSKTNIDKTIVIAVSEIYSNGSTSAAELFTYGDYDIQGNDMYHLNYRVKSGNRRYLVEVYRPTTSGVEVLGSREVRVK